MLLSYAVYLLYILVLLWGGSCAGFDSGGVSGKQAESVFAPEAGGEKK